MKYCYPLTLWTLGLGLGLVPIEDVQAQAPAITAVTPLANATAAARSGPVTVSFSQPLTAGSAAALQVFSAQRGGRRTQALPAIVSGSTLSFTPIAYPFRPGETVRYTVSTLAAGTGGALATPRVGQFTAAVGGTGRGTFQLGSDLPVGGSPQDLALADLDGDGDLDLLTVGVVLNTVSIRLNAGNGNFGAGQEVAVGLSPNGLAVGDIDGDGDLDLLTANLNANTVSVRLNNGLGVFVSAQEVPVGDSPSSVALGDVDGDGDLDFLVNAAPGTTAGAVSIRLNNGVGTFSGTQSVSAVGSRGPLVVGDVDNDGDLDVLITGNGSNTVSVRVNNGSGTFGPGQDISVNASPYGLTVGDVDGDGDLDLVAANFTSNTASVRLNNGSGTFSGTQEVVAGPGPRHVALGDVDADGDLDLLIANANSTITGIVSVRLNNGSGTFGGTQSVGVGELLRGVVMGDVDGDGDLDLLTITSNSTGLASVRLNGGTGLASTPATTLTGLDLFPNPAPHAFQVAGAAANTVITVADALGRVLLSAQADTHGTASLVLPATLAPGLYVLRNGNQTRRVLVD